MSPLHKPTGHVPHGGIDLAELRSLGLSPEEVLDFSASVTPLGTPAAVREAIAKVDFSRYPDRDCLALREALSRHCGWPVEGILPGNGSTELIHLIAASFLTPPSGAFVFAPAFGEYDAAARAQGASVEEARASAGIGFHWDIDAALGRLAFLKPPLTFLCNPNNPTGVLLDEQAVRAIAKAVRPGLLVLDEAYMPLADAPWDTMPLLAEGNVLLLRSMTKDYGLAGVRLGYLLGEPDVVARVKRRQISWSVNAVAQAAGIAALGCREHLQRTREVLLEGKRYLMEQLPAVGLKPLPSAANFLLVQAGDVSRFRGRLLERRILVRDCASFGLPEYVRISVRGISDCKRLIAAAKEALALG